MFHVLAALYVSVAMARGSRRSVLECFTDVSVCFDFYALQHVSLSIVYITSKAFATEFVR